MSECKADVVENFYTVDGFGKVFYHKYFVADFTVRTEIDIWIFAAGWTHVIKLDFFQGTFT